jgi:uncharacterized protein
MSEITRRPLLSFFGATAALTVLDLPVHRRALSPGAASAAVGSFTPVRLPHPLPIYTEQASFLATGIGTGSVQAVSAIHGSLPTR